MPMTTSRELHLTAEPRTVRAARRFLVDALRELDVSDETTSVAQLALSEIVTNAVVHGAEPILLGIASDSTTVEISVTDASTAQPHIYEAPIDSTRGRGLAIVAAVAGSWGSEPLADGAGKRVWFVVQR